MRLDIISINEPSKMNSRLRSRYHRKNLVNAARFIELRRHIDPTVNSSNSRDTDFTIEQHC